ncbi:CNNM family magnesium/cobalt transport protein CorC [Motilimonas eburnea]|uniref:CNNM family magnesium/cobalt transport protein CorC n=1 Tax=Motilimonas eburnea TaxID=1737488 RepID=UPI001E4A6F38|nr:CNNM family magnesium/cobalt transport protein CorC [Motilimonas eburnea]MCE2569966.1 CNNM family magnesium/cobalt transport protein CorC [Motilimonas eburnea]
MSDDIPQPSGSAKRGWLGKFSQMFQAEPKSQEELVEVIQEANQRDLIDQNTAEMIEGVLDVSKMRVRDIMIPRSQMVTIEKSQSVDTFLPIVIESAHSRFPVINEDKDHIEGIMLAKDLISFGFSNQQEDFSLSKILRPAVVVPESKRLDKLLKEFRSERYHMAIVVDEYGGVSGLVTIEDILELIVGEIEDETDAEDAPQEDIRRISKRHYSVRALTPIEDFNETFNVNFADDEQDTIGGMVMHAFGHLPARGESIEIEGFTFKVVSADKRRLIQLQVKLPDNVTDSLVETE